MYFQIKNFDNFDFSFQNLGNFQLRNQNNCISVTFESKQWPKILIENRDTFL